MKRPILRSREHLDAGFPLAVVEVEQACASSHAHDFYEMVYVRRGRGTHIIEDHPYPIRAGDFYFLRPGESHSYVPDGPLKIVNILWQPDLVREIMRADKDSSLAFLKPFLRSRAKSQPAFRRLHLSGSAAFRVENLLDEMRREIAAASGDASVMGCHAMLRHLFCALLVLLSRAHAAASTRAKSNRANSQTDAQHSIARAIMYLEERSSETIRVPEIAAHVALSPGRFAHLFKAHTGRSPIEYLHELRLEKVCAALRESTLPIQEIAGEAGYNDSRFFHRVFRRHAGCNPTEYRSQFLP